MALDVKSYYDSYWRDRDLPCTEARSRERAAIAVDLLCARKANAAGRLLDLGCGPGLSLRVFRDAGYDAAGADASAVAVDEVRKLGFPAELLDLENDSLAPLMALLDALPQSVVALEVLEHLVDPCGFLERLRAVLPQDAALVVSLPNEIHLLARLRVLWGRLPFGGHADPHLRHFDRPQALALFAAAGYRVAAAKAVHMLPPRYGGLRSLTQPALWLAPGCFSLATVYLLEAESK